MEQLRDTPARQRTIQHQGHSAPLIVAYDVQNSFNEARVAHFSRGDQELAREVSFLLDRRRPIRREARGEEQTASECRSDTQTELLQESMRKRDHASLSTTASRASPPARFVCKKRAGGARRVRSL
jgi:hypothetical protein